MKHLYMCAAALAMGVLIVVPVGCNKDMVDAGRGMKARLEQQFKDSTVLLRIEGQLAQARDARNSMKSMADDLDVKANATLRGIKRIETEKEKVVARFETLNNAAQDAGLPPFVDAGPEGMAKTIRVGTRNFTGSQIYQTLRELKSEVERANTTTERGRIRSDFLMKRAETIRAQVFLVNRHIADMENEIEDYKMYAELVQIGETLDLADSKMKELLNTGSNLSAINRSVDDMATKVKQMDDRFDTMALMRELDGFTFSITSDDLP